MAPQRENADALPNVRLCCGRSSHSGVAATFTRVGADTAGPQNRHLSRPSVTNRR